MIPRFQFGAAGEERSYRVVLGLLLLAVLAPTACLLYFINEAVSGQRNLARQKLDDAYRGQLRLVSERIDAFWEQRARDLDARPDNLSPALFFEHCVRDGLADSVICLDRDGSPAYPSLAGVPRADPTIRQPQWMEARALEDDGKAAEAALRYGEIARIEREPSLAARAGQAQARCLAASGQKMAAFSAIEAQNQVSQLAFATGLDGRLIMADELALEMRLVPDELRSDRARALFGIVQNYSRQMPSAQRLFLMDLLRSGEDNPRNRTFPTYQAERGAERILSAGLAAPGEPVLVLSGIGDAWKLTSPGKRTIAFYQTATVIAAMRNLLGNENSTFSLTAPGRNLPPHQESMVAGSHLPGWQLSLNIPNGGIATQHQIASYLWIGFLTVAVVAVLAGVGGQVLRRQMRIAHLKTDLVAAVSHELKTPLASMKLLVESLLSGDQFEPKRTRQYLQLVAHENSRLSRLIDNFLTFSRMERNRGNFHFARVQSEAVVQAAVESIGERFSVEVKVDGNLPPLYADEDAIVTVLLNLLENAYKYTDEKNRRIELRVFGNAGRVLFAVKDNGIGIAESERKKIFRRFYQVDRRLARQAGGVGLGLSIVEFIVKAHGGEISVYSRPGQGSTFTVSLPPSSSSAEVAA